MIDLEKKLEAKMWDNCHTAKRELDYDAKKYAQILRANGAVNAAKILINQDAPTAGFERLWNKNVNPRLDLSAEAAVVDNPRFHSLFDDKTIKKAKVRLRGCGYKFKN